MREFCRLDKSGEALTKAARQQLVLSARAFHRVLKVARTIADLAGKEGIDTAAVAEAIQYRSLDREWWRVLRICILMSNSARIPHLIEQARRAFVGTFR